jgi:hypothetical protein
LLPAASTGSHPLGQHSSQSRCNGRRLHTAAAGRAGHRGQPPEAVCLEAAHHRAVFSLWPRARSVGIDPHQGFSHWKTRPRFGGAFCLDLKKKPRRRAGQKHHNGDACERVNAGLAPPRIFVDKLGGAPPRCLGSSRLCVSRRRKAANASHRSPSREGATGRESRLRRVRHGLHKRSPAEAGLSVTQTGCRRQRLLVAAVRILTAAVRILVLRSLAGFDR